MNYQVREKEGQIEVKREPMPYTMQSTLYSYSNTADFSMFKFTNSLSKCLSSVELSQNEDEEVLEVELK